MPIGERRAGRRWAISEGVLVEIVGRGRAVTLINVGPGGFAVASEQQLAAMARPEFKFSMPGQNWSTVLMAQMAYCLMQPRKAGRYQGQYVTGYTFCDAGAPAVRDRITEFLEHVSPPA
jgi:hypothetical protein